MHFTNRPCAAHGLTSYRLKGAFGWIMIGATGEADAMSEAARSTNTPDRSALEIWDSHSQSYVKA